MRRTVNIWANMDWITVFIYLFLVFMGWFNIYAAVYSEEHSSIFDMEMRYGKQLIWIIAAFFIALIIIFVDLRFYSLFAYVVYALALLMLLAVAFVGKEVNGARSWFEFGSIRLQPTEFAKATTCLAIAKFLSSYNIKIEKLSTLFMVGALIFAPAVLIMLQPDFGSIIVYVALIFVLYREGFPGGFLFYGFFIVLLFVISLVASQFTVMLFLAISGLVALVLINRSYIESIIAGAGILAVYFLLRGIDALFGTNIGQDYSLIIALITVSIGGIVYFLFRRVPPVFWIALSMIGAIAFNFSVDYIFNNMLEPHQKQRVNILLGKESDPRGAEYNVNQSKIAIGSGGFFGKGFLQGTQTKFNFVPEQSTDFIFCTVGEEWGFVGSLFVLAIFSFLLIRLIFMAERQRSAFSRIYGYGVVSILFFHFAINIGMTIGLLPVIGIPLPFFSYGGSSLWAFTILLFIFLRLDAGRLELFR